jgi:hypothetical protein
MSVSSIYRLGIHANLGPCLTNAAVTDLQALSSDHSTLVLCPDVLDTCSFHLTNKELSNKSFYSISFRHLQVDDQASKVWRNAAT